MGFDNLACPDVTFLEFVSFFGNVYVNEFSGRYLANDCGITENGKIHEELCGEIVPKTTDVLLTRAKR